MPIDFQHTTASLAQRLKGELVGADLKIRSVNSLADAQADEITFIASGAFANRWADCNAGAAVITRGLNAQGHDPESRALIVVENAELALIQLLELFQPSAAKPELGVHPSAWIHDDSSVGESSRIGAHVSIDRRVRIGKNVTLHPGVRIAAEAVIGDDCELHANCVVGERCVLGTGVILHANVSIGADGFGYRPAPDGRSLIKMPHIGNVVLEDDVEIGANSCVDRAKFSSTVIGAGSKVDNLVQIAHNCRIGSGCVIAGQAGLAGSVRVGNMVQIGAQAGIAEGLSIGDGAQIGAKSGVMQNIPAKTAVLGTPAQNARLTLRQVAAIRKLPDMLNEFSRQKRASS